MWKVVSVLAACCLASPAFAQDPVKVDPTHHKVELENDQVRVLRITFGPGEKAPLHGHPDSVAVFLTDVLNRVTPAGGQPDETPRKRGQTLALAAGKHTVENIGTARSEVLLVELKTPAAMKWPGVAQDPVKLDPKRYRVELENERVRVLRITYEGRGKSVMHDHAPSVVVALVDSEFRFTGPAAGAASQRPSALKAGQALWADAETHLPENLTDKAFEAVLVELKTKLPPRTMEP